LRGCGFKTQAKLQAIFDPGLLNKTNYDSQPD